MPLLDHFHPPLSTQRHWESFHASWAVKLADTLTEQVLPPHFIAEAVVHIGPSVEIDVATLERSPEREITGNGTGTLAVSSRVWKATAPSLEIPATFPNTFEVRVFNIEGGPRLVAAIELVSPGNKDRAEERRAFCVKCASYLHEGVSLVTVDVVTTRRANLHNEMMRLMEVGASFELTGEQSLYAMAYRPVRRDEKNLIDAWTFPLALGHALPVMPLALGGDLVVPVDLESAYVEACRKKRLF